jgi:ABC-type methionine transport system ATPase subunit
VSAAKKKDGKKPRKEHQRYWLMFPGKLVQRPVIHELGHKYKVVTNIRQATVHEDVGLVSLEVEGERNELKKAVKWLEKRGVKVEPVEINVIEG